MKIIMIVFFFMKMNSFVNKSDIHEYEIICEDANDNCIQLHDQYKMCGKLIFDLWLFLDLMQSVSIEDNQYDLLYGNIMLKIMQIYDILLILYVNDESEHFLDKEKIHYFIQKIKNHPIIYSIDFFKSIIFLCEKIVKK